MSTGTDGWEVDGAKGATDRDGSRPVELIDNVALNSLAVVVLDVEGRTLVESDRVRQ